MISGKTLNKIITFVLTFLGSFIGQLYVRITRFDGSLDNWWLLIPPISVPPLSLIPAFMLTYKKIKTGEGGSPYDFYMLVPAITSMLTSSFLKSSDIFPGVFKTILLFVINFASVYYALYKRDIDICINNKIKSNYEKFTVNNLNNLKANLNKNLDSTLNNIGQRISKYTKTSYTKILVQTAIIAGLMPLIPYLLRLTPYIGSIIEKLGSISPLMGIAATAFIKMVCIILLYTIINMINGRNIKKSCKSSYKMRTVFTTVVLSLVMNILIVTGGSSLVDYE